MYGVISSTTKKIKKLYGAISSTTRNIKKVYGVVGGVTRLIYTSEVEVNLSFPINLVTTSNDYPDSVNDLLINGATFSGATIVQCGSSFYGIVPKYGNTLKIYFPEASNYYGRCVSVSITSATGATFSCTVKASGFYSNSNSNGYEATSNGVVYFYFHDSYSYSNPCITFTYNSNYYVSGIKIS